jgi:putative ABC transport system permease protein
MLTILKLALLQSWETSFVALRALRRESMILSVLGGFVGVACGIAISRLVQVFADFKAIVTLGSVVLAFGVSCAIGVFFGFYPARKAAALDPIEALRYE